MRRIMTLVVIAIVAMTATFAQDDAQSRDDVKYTRTLELTVDDMYALAEGFFLDNQYDRAKYWIHEAMKVDTIYDESQGEMPSCDEHTLLLQIEWIEANMTNMDNFNVNGKATFTNTFKAADCIQTSSLDGHYSTWSSKMSFIITTQGAIKSYLDNKWGCIYDPNCVNGIENFFVDKDRKFKTFHRFRAVEVVSYDEETQILVFKILDGRNVRYDLNSGEAYIMAD